jgi:hypothetical protein
MRNTIDLAPQKHGGGPVATLRSKLLSRKRKSQGRDQVK